MSQAHPPITMRRWTEQRWLLDNIIRSVGIDWDQPRTITYNTPCGPEANADFGGIRERVKITRISRRHSRPLRAAAKSRRAPPRTLASW